MSFPATLPEPPRRVGVVRALQLGDFLVAVPALRTLRRALPSAEITLIGLPWAAQVVRRFRRYLDDFLEFPGYPGIRERDPDPARLATFLDAARRRSFDLAVQMHGSGVASNPFTCLLGARRTAGFVTEGDASPLDLRVPYERDRHEVCRYLDLVEALTGARGDPQLEFPVLPGDRRELSRCGFEPGSGRYLVVHPGARAASRRWMPERFAEVADRLAERYRLDVVVSGGPGEGAVVEEVSRRLRRRPFPVPTDIGVGALAALLEGAVILVSNDTGAAHLADAVGTRTVVVFGSVDPGLWRPLDGGRHRALFVPMPCRPSRCDDCPYDHACLRAIDADAVVAAACDLLDAA
jgi:ADP-heptose:LPS heptosyltransferase